MGIMTLLQEIINLLDWQVLLVLSLSTSLGIVIGALPGLTATMGIALLTGLTYKIPTYLAIPLLMGIYVGAIYGGSISAVLINIPGTGAAAATALDGFPLAQKGEALTALNATRWASGIGTAIGLFALIGFAPLISMIAEKAFASPEFFLLAMFGIIICGSLTAGEKPIKGWIAGFMGIMLSCVGIEEIHGYQRFVFGNPNLIGGIAFIPAMIGVFGIPQIIQTLRGGSAEFAVVKVDKEKDKGKLFRLLRINIMNIIRSGILGVGIGAIPGAGEDIAAWMSYDRAKKASKHPEEFGKGSYEGIIAAETANNSCIGGAIIPLLTLAVPGSAPAAVLLGALYLHGIRPGPMLSFEFPNFIYEMTAILFWATVALFIYGLLLSKVMVKVLKVKPTILMPIVGVLCVIGAYAIGVNRFDILVMTITGIIGYFLVEMGFPPAAFILGAILGPLADSNLRRTLLTYDGSLMPFVTRPISLIFTILIAISILSQFKFWGKMWSKIRIKPKNS
jgi:putative tricarboxylic transport membrane protein